LNPPWAKTKRNMIILFVLLGCLLLPDWASGSRPVRAMMVGCVVEGLFISREITMETSQGVRTSHGSYFMRVRGIELKNYEGQTLRLAGFLYPGDLFFASEQKLEVLSPSCDRESIPHFRETFSWAYRTLARERSDKKNYEEALKFINRAIEIDAAQCEFYLTRAEIFKAQGRLDLAAEDEKKGADRGCGK
jgi:hypothetical protein